MLDARQTNKIQIKSNMGHSNVLNEVSRQEPTSNHLERGNIRFYICEITDHFSLPMSLSICEIDVYSIYLLIDKGCFHLRREIIFFSVALFFGGIHIHYLPS